MAPLSRLMAALLALSACHALAEDPSGPWQPVMGTWSYDAGRFLQANLRKDETYCFLREPVVSDFTLSARFFTYPQGAGVRAAGLAFRSQDSATNYFAHFDAKNSQMILYLQYPGGYKELDRVGSLALAAGQWHGAEVTCQGPTISVTLDGKVISRVQDSTYLKGRVGLRTGQGKAAFEDVALRGTLAAPDKEWTVMPESLKPDETDVPKLTNSQRIVAERGGGYFPVLIKLTDGRLMAVVRGGASHLGIKGRLDLIESADGGKSWSAPRTVVDSDWDDRNPALGQMPNGTIVLAYAECQCYNDKLEYDPSVRGFYWKFMLSKDGAQTWTAPRPLTHGPVGFDSSPYGRIIVLRDGTALMSVYGSVNKDYAGPDKLPADAGPWVCGLLRSTDNGETWGDFSPISVRGHNETTLMQLPDGTLLAAMRTASGVLDIARSTDAGRTWSDPAPVTGGPARDRMQHPADLCLLQSGRVLMVYGNRLEPYGVEAITSPDGGKTFGYDQRVLLAWDSLHTDCGYPSAVQLAGGTIVCVYYSVGTEELPEDEQALAVRFSEGALK